MEPINDDVKKVEPSPTTDEKKVDPSPTTDVKKVDPSPTQPTEEKTPIPVSKQPEEDPVKFNLRQQLKDASNLFKEAPEGSQEKSLLQREMSKIRQKISTVSKDDSKHIDTPKPEEKPTETNSIDEVVKKIRELGFVTQEEVKAEANKIAETTFQRSRADEIQKEQSKAIEEFYSERPDIVSDASLREGLEAWVLNNFKITENTPASVLKSYLTIAANTFVPVDIKSEQAKDSQKKVNLLSIDSSGGEGSEKKVKGTEQERQLLRDKGWKEEAIELLYS